MANKKFANKPLYDEVVRRFSAYVGTSFQKGVTASGRPVEVYALFGGQWPHSSYTKEMEKLVQDVKLVEEADGHLSKLAALRKVYV